MTTARKSAHEMSSSRFAPAARGNLGPLLSFPGYSMPADINDLIARMESAWDERHGIVLTKDEVDELLWAIGELQIGNQMQAHMIALLEAERKPVNLH